MDVLTTTILDNEISIYVLIIAVLLVLVINLFAVISSKRKEIKATKKKAADDVAKAEQKARYEVSAMKTTCDKRINDLIAEHNEEKNAIRLDCANQIKRLKEKIENRKETLSQMSEKELLANIILALDGYAGRLNRIESHLTEDVITKSLALLMKDFAQRIEDISDTLDNQMNDLNYTIQNGFNNSDVLQKLYDIESELEDVSSEVSEIQSNVSYGITCNCSSDIDDVKEYVNSIRYTIDEIYSKIVNE